MKKTRLYFILLPIAMIFLLMNPVVSDQELENRTLILKDGNDKSSIYMSQLIDLYFIAASLYYNFEESTLVNYNTENTLYDAVIEFYSEYSEHDFIKNLYRYLDVYNLDINSGFLMELVSYLWLGQTQLDIAMLEEFLIDISTFYDDTNSYNFFENQYKHYYTDLDYFINNNIDFSLFNNLIREIDIYLEHENFSETHKYTIIFSLLRPHMASFYNLNNNFIAILSPYAMNINFEFDENQIIKTLIHEILHGYINEYVYNYNDDILHNVTTFNWHEAEFNTRNPYARMPWHRIFDENLVRAVQARIYYNFFKSEDVIDYILLDEYKIGGFRKVYDFYDLLERYETNREHYSNVEDYIPQIIEEIFVR